MLSILSPTHKRPHHIIRLIDSIKATVDNLDEIELVLYIDDDDDSYDELLKQDLDINLKYIYGPRIVISDMWNKCYEIAEGPYYHHSSDDCVYASKGWDTLVKSNFEKYDDKIMFLYGRDGLNDHILGTLGFLHKNWVEAVGYFVPPYFMVDWCDTWLNDVADLIDRKIYDKNIYTEHMHWAAGKSEMDDTYVERDIVRQQDSGGELYYSSDMKNKREEDAVKLNASIENHRRTQ